MDYKNCTCTSVDYFLSKAINTISEKYTHYDDIVKHEEIVKFQATKKCDTSFDTPLNYKCTLKISTSYLLVFSRNQQNSICKGKRKIKLIHTNLRIKIKYDKLLIQV